MSPPLLFGGFGGGGGGGDGGFLGVCRQRGGHESEIIVFISDWYWDWEPGINQS